MSYEQGKIEKFTDLNSWKEAHSLTLFIYKVTKKFPKEELFALTSQIRRSCSSISANIAEGFGRFTFKDRAHFYTQANGSLTELQNHIILARDLQYITYEEFDTISKQSTIVQQLLRGLIRRTKEYSVKS